jgi:ABC-type uncharacterized transport system substrate-binding protein
MPFDQLHRRELITLLGGAAAAWPLAASAQQPAMPVVGFMSSGSPGPLRRQIAAVHEGLKEAGYVDGQNVALEFRFAEGQFDRFPALAAELVRRQVTVLMATNAAGALAARQATSTIPIVFSVGDDPVKTGLVDSLHRPGGNMTGVYQFASGLEGKRLSLLHDLVPQVTTVAAMVHPSFSGAETQLRDLREAASRLGVQLVILTARKRFPHRFRDLGSTARRCASGLRYALLQQPAPAACAIGDTPRGASDLRMARVR